jgi:hypothetical protein
VIVLNSQNDPIIILIDVVLGGRRSPAKVNALSVILNENRITLI